MTKTSCVCVFVYMYRNTQTVNMYIYIYCVCAYIHTHKHTSMYVMYVCVYSHTYILDFIVFQFSASFSSRGCIQLITNILVWWMKWSGLSVSYLGETLECPLGNFHFILIQKALIWPPHWKAPAGIPDYPATAAWGDVGCPFGSCLWLISCH